MLNTPSSNPWLSKIKSIRFLVFRKLIAKNLFGDEGYNQRGGVGLMRTHHASGGLADVSTHLHFAEVSTHSPMVCTWPSGIPVAWP